jgi:large subunit ribosomal protein L22
VLQYTNKRAADGIEKCVRSAIANATEAAEKANIAVDPDDLWVKACFIDMGPTKNRSRMRPAPQGRAFRERRHFHHVTVLLSSDEKETATKRRGGDAETKRASSKSSAREKKSAAGAESKRSGAVKADRIKKPTKSASKKTEEALAETAQE